MRADLHVHSTASDGALTPSLLVQSALEVHLDVLAITDHDSVEGVAEAQAAAQRSDLKVIPAVELSSVAEDGRDVHVLGYFVDPFHSALLGDLSALRSARVARALDMVSLLADSGFEIQSSQVMHLAAGGAVGRVHIARVLVSAGHAESIADAFGRFIGRDRPFYVEKARRSPSEAIDTIRRAGGIAVLAHPGVSQLDDVIGGLVSAGLGGLEAYHGDHTPEQRVHYAHLAKIHGLLATGGSDFHSVDAPNSPLGGVEIPSAVIESFLRAGALAEE